MKYTRLGRSGLEVSRVTLGCMSFGASDRGSSWTLGFNEARTFFRQALEAGITTFDTANTYGQGSSEEITGTLLAELAPRDEVVIATKVFFPMHQGPKGRGLSRGAIFAQVDQSLRRLGTDYIDLYQIHRYDPSAPIAETMEALHDLVSAGKVRYLGASSMWTWQFAQAQHLADLHRWTRFVSMQNHYNLIMREEEREMLPFCQDQGIGVLPYSALARGKLARNPDVPTDRGRNDGFARVRYQQDLDSDNKIIEAAASVAANRGVTKAQVALAWVLHNPAVTSPIIGATKPHHITDAVAAVDLALSDEEVTWLEESYTLAIQKASNSHHRLNQ
ncbi:aldo/keto reductase [Pseudonocardia spinosispora]|uniref:aldo/keto reductase n=1 Tax=Pseudonocardia spinosispora TaxID=103441 RepID=UPI00041647B9|nr:aldo/keto reductase [Pseudonocardia spinosispora]